MCIQIYAYTFLATWLGMLLCRGLCACTVVPCNEPTILVMHPGSVGAAVYFAYLLLFYLSIQYVCVPFMLLRHTFPSCCPHGAAEGLPALHFGVLPCTVLCASMVAPCRQPTILVMQPCLPGAATYLAFWQQKGSKTCSGCSRINVSVLGFASHLFNV